MDITKRKGKIVLSNDVIRNMLRVGQNHLAFMVVMFTQPGFDTVTFLGNSELFAEAPAGVVPEYTIMVKEDGRVTVLAIGNG